MSFRPSLRMSRALPAYTGMLAFALLLSTSIDWAQAEFVAFGFRGNLSFVVPPIPPGHPEFGPPFGLDVAAGDEVRGWFILNPLQPATPGTPACDCGLYKHSIFKGFVARTTSHWIQVDQYVAEISNNFPQQGGGDGDVISIRWSSKETPPLNVPLLVDGISYAKGQFSLNLLGPTDTFDSPQIPAQINVPEYVEKIGILAHSETIANAFFNITSIDRLTFLPGDFDSNRILDGTDLLAWQRSLGVEPLVNGIGDATASAADLALWKDSYGASLVEPSASNVPEPTTFVGVIAAAPISLAIAGRRRGRSPSLRRCDRHCPRKSTAAGFSLAEILTVTAMVSTLAAMLLPAIQSARESARRATCQDNLRQQGVALLGFEGTYKAFPIGSRSRESGEGLKATYGTSWWVDLLPFIEQQSVSDRFDFASPNTGYALSHLANGRLAHNFSLPISLCPSSSLPHFWPIGSFQILMPHYVGIAGAYADADFPEERVTPCCVKKGNAGQVSGGGVLVPNAAIRSKDISDGLSTTIISGESSDFAIEEEGTQRRVDGGFNLGWLAGTTGSGTPPDYNRDFTFAPQCYNITTLRYPVNTRDYNLPGIVENGGPNNPLLSSHPGGALVLFVGGAVRFLPNDTDVLALKKLGTRDDGD